MDVDVDERIGAFCGANGVARMMAITLRGIDELVREQRLLALNSSSGKLLAPAFQFGPTGELLLHLADALQILDPDGREPLSAALWMNRSAGRFLGLTPAEKLRADGAAEVLASARQIESS